MSALTRFNRLKNPARSDTPALFDDLLRNFALSPLWRDTGVPAPDMPIDITEDEKAYRITAEIPGVDKDDIEVSVEGNQVSISAEAKREVEKGDAREVVLERAYGRAYRAFALPGEVDGTRTEARYDKGVLTLTLPKKENGSARRIAVS